MTILLGLLEAAITFYFVGVAYCFCRIVFTMNDLVERKQDWPYFLVSAAVMSLFWLNLFNSKVKRQRREAEEWRSR